MPLAMARLIFGAIAVVAFLNVCEGTALCSGGELSEADVNSQVLAIVNGYRSKLTKGEQPNGHNNGLLPAGKNMNKLSWSCALEQEAMQTTGTTCPEQQPAAKSNKAAIFLSEYDYGEEISFMLESLLEGINGVSLTSITGPVKYSGETGLESYANMVRATTTQIGCNLNRCTAEGRYALYCLTDQAPLQNGETLYEIGSTTTTNCTCEQQGYVCDTDGFCVPTSITPTTGTVATTTTSSNIGASGATVPTGGSNSMCNTNTGMTDALRTKFVDMHNYRRSLLAQGKCAKNNGNLLPRAQNMAKLIYSCSLESEALTYAQQCPQSGSGGGTNGENFYRGAMAGTFEDGAKKAVTSWWKVVRQHSGIGMKAMFRANHVGTPITSFTQMAWATTKNVGCSIVQCASDYVAVCRYSQKGNVVGSNVYIPGNTCAMCSSTCVSAEGLCA